MSTLPARIAAILIALSLAACASAPPPPPEAAPPLLRKRVDAKTDLEYGRRW